MKNLKGVKRQHVRQARSCAGSGASGTGSEHAGFAQFVVGVMEGIQNGLALYTNRGRNPVVLLKATTDMQGDRLPLGSSSWVIFGVTDRVQALMSTWVPK